MLYLLEPINDVRQDMTVLILWFYLQDKYTEKKGLCPFIERERVNN